MPTRTRSRSYRVNPSTYSKNQMTGTRTSGVAASDNTVWTYQGAPSTVDVPLLMQFCTEEITDEQPTDRHGINEVTHKKVTPVRWDRAIDPTTYMFGRGDTMNQFKGSGPAYYWRGYSTKTDTASRYMNAMVMRPPDSKAFFNRDAAKYGYCGLASSTPTDKLGLLPAKIVSRLESWHGSTSLIEAREFPALFRMFTRRGKLVQLIRSGDLATSGIGRGKRAWEALTDTALGYQYGLRPTISDLRKLAEEASRLKAKSLRFSVSEIQKATDSYEVRDIWTTGSKPGETSIQSGSSTITRVDGCRVDATRAFSRLEDFTRRYIGLNGAGLIWEVLPFSFVIDAFLHIDDVLDSLFLGTRTDIKTQYWTSTRVENIARWSMTPRCSEGYSRWVWNDQSSVKVEFDYPVPVEVGYDSTLYTRVRRVPPSPLSALRLTGVDALQGFYYFLIAAGLMSRSSR